jgi:hypothetical protein
MQDNPVYQVNILFALWLNPSAHWLIFEKLFLGNTVLKMPVLMIQAFSMKFPENSGHAGNGGLPDKCSGELPHFFKARMGCDTFSLMRTCTHGAIIGCDRRHSAQLHCVQGRRRVQSYRRIFAIARMEV